MGVGRIFSGGAKWIFPGVAKKIFPWGPKLAKFYFIHLKARKQLFLLKI